MIDATAVLRPLPVAESHWPDAGLVVANDNVPQPKSFLDLGGPSISYRQRQRG